MMKSPQNSGRQCLIAALALASAGCADLSGVGGTSQFACRAPEGVKCDSVSGNYYNSIQNNLPSQKSKAKATGQPRPVPHAAGPVAASLRPANFEPTPMRSQSQVRRVWIKTWEDSDHDLHDQAFVYMHDGGGRWLVDHAQRRVREEYAPLRPPANDTAAVPAGRAPAPPGELGRGDAEENTVAAPAGVDAGAKGVLARSAAQEK